MGVETQTRTSLHIATRTKRQKFLSWVTSLMIIVGELAGGGSVAVAVALVTGDTSYMTHDM